MFENIGKNAVDGAVQRIKSLILGLNPARITGGLDILSLKVPIIGDIRRAYESMSDEERATMMKNLMIAGAALAAQMASKSGKKLEF